MLKVRITPVLITLRWIKVVQEGVIEDDVIRVEDLMRFMYVLEIYYFSISEFSEFSELSEFS